MAKVTVRKVDGRWQSSRSGFGFAGKPIVLSHASWTEALAASLPTPGTAYAQVERRPSWDYQVHRGVSFDYDQTPR